MKKKILGGVAVAIEILIFSWPIAPAIGFQNLGGFVQAVILLIAYGCMSATWYFITATERHQYVQPKKNIATGSVKPTANNTAHRPVRRWRSWLIVIAIPLLIIVGVVAMIGTKSEVAKEYDSPTATARPISQPKDDWSIATVALPNGGKRILKINKATGETFTLLSGKWSKVETETLETVQMRRVLLAIRKAEPSMKNATKRVTIQDIQLGKLSDEELEAIANGTDDASRVEKLFQQSDHKLWSMIKKNSDQNLSFKAIEKMTDEELYSIVLDALVYEMEKR